MILVTGITGHSGSWLLRKLAAEGYPDKIRCVIRKTQEEAPEKYKLFENCRLDLEYVIGDLKDEEFLSEALKDVETVIHIAGVRLSPKIVDTAIRNGVRRAILVHTTGRFSKFKSASKDYISIEDSVLSRRSDSFSITVLRPTMIYGSSKDRNMYRLVEYLSKHRFFPLFGNGSNLMQPVHARDLGYAYYGVLVHPDTTRNKEYDLSGKEPIPYLSIIKTIKRLLNSKAIIFPIPITLSIFAAKVYNAVFKKAIITVEQVMRMQEDKAFSHEAAANDFGYDPLSFEEGIAEEVNEYLSGVRVDYSGIRYK